MNLQIFFEFREMLGMSRINHCRRCHPKEVGRFHSRITYIGHTPVDRTEDAPYGMRQRSRAIQARLLGHNASVWDSPSSVESNLKPCSLFQGIIWALGILEKRGSAPSVLSFFLMCPG